MFFTTTEDTVLNNIEMSLRGGYRKVREYIPTRDFVYTPRVVDSIMKEHIARFLGHLYPDAPVCEDVIRAFSAPRSWLIDPFDGPLNERTQTSRGASTLALIEYGQPVAAGVYDIAKDRIYVASNAHGHYAIDSDGFRSWLNPARPLYNEIDRTGKPRCLDIMDVVAGTRTTFSTVYDDPSDLIAALFIAESSGCIVRNRETDHGLTMIDVASDRIAHARMLP